MNVRKALVSFLAIAFIFVLASTLVSAADIASDYQVEVNGIDALTDVVSVVAGDTITVRIFFTADNSTVGESASDVRIKAVLEGEKQDVEARTSFFDVEGGKRYVKTLSLKVPFDLRDEVSDDLPLDIKIWNSDLSTEIDDIVLRVQRPSYDIDIAAVNTDRTVKAGEIFPVEIVLQNRGYNNLEDLSVNVRIPALGVEKTAFFGDLVNIEDEDTDEDDTDTVSGKLYLTVPYDADAGTYTLEVRASNEDSVSSVVKEITVENEFPSAAIQTKEGLLLVNPTNSLVAYRILTPDDDSIVTIPAGLSKTVEITPTSEEYEVTVLTMSGMIVDRFSFKASEQPEQAAVNNTVVAFTVILALVFLVLLIVLIVLITRKPQKTEELGESYY